MIVTSTKQVSERRPVEDIGLEKSGERRHELFETQFLVVGGQLIERLLPPGV